MINDRRRKRNVKNLFKGVGGEGALGGGGGSSGGDGGGG